MFDEAYDEKIKRIRAKIKEESVREKRQELRGRGTFIEVVDQSGAHMFVPHEHLRDFFGLTLEGDDDTLSSTGIDNCARRFATVIVSPKGEITRDAYASPADEVVFVR